MPIRIPRLFSRKTPKPVGPAPVPPSRDPHWAPAVSVFDFGQNGVIHSKRAIIIHPKGTDHVTLVEGRLHGSYVPVQHHVPGLIPSSEVFVANAPHADIVYDWRSP